MINKTNINGKICATANCFKNIITKGALFTMQNMAEEMLLEALKFSHFMVLDNSLLNKANG